MLSMRAAFAVLCQIHSLLAYIGPRDVAATRTRTSRANQSIESQFIITCMCWALCCGGGGGGDNGLAYRYAVNTSYRHPEAGDGWKSIELRSSHLPRPHSLSPIPIVLVFHFCALRKNEVLAAATRRMNKEKKMPNIFYLSWLIRSVCRLIVNRMVRNGCFCDHIGNRWVGAHIFVYIIRKSSELETFA